MSRAIVIDVPMREMERAAERATEPRCNYQNIDGGACFRPAMERKEFCSLHHYWNCTPASAMGLPFPQDMSSMQEFLARMVDLAMSGKIRKGQAPLIETLCRLLAENVRLMGR